MPFALELPEIGAVGVLLIAWIVLMATADLILFLTFFLKYVPVIGGFIQNQLVSHVVDWLRTGAGWAASGMGSLVGLIWTPIKWLGVLFRDNLEMELQALGWATNHVQNVLPSLLGQQAGFSTQLYHQAIAYADQDLAAASATAQSLYGQSVADLDVAEGALSGFATQLYDQALAYTDQAAGRLSGFATQLYDQALAHADADAGAVAGFATQLYHQAIAYTDQGIGQITTWVGGEVQALRGEIGSVADSIPGVVSVALAPALAEVVALTDRIATVEECAGPICEAGAAPNLAGLSNLMNDLGALFTDGALFGFLAAAVIDPQGTAEEVIGLVGGLVEDTASAVTNLVHAA